MLEGSLATLRTLSVAAALAVLYLGAIGAALTFYLWSYALEPTTPAQVAITVALNPVVAMVLAVPLLGESLSPRLIVGLAAVLGGIALAARQGR